MDIDTLIIGGGAAGLAAACFASPNSLVLERLPQSGRKILTTGGGRCNFTHDADAAAIAACNPRCRRFVLPALYHFSPDALRAFFAELGVCSHAEPDGCVFPDSQRAADILAALLACAQRRGTAIRTGVEVLGWTVAGEGPERRIVSVETTQGKFFPRCVILATGGQSYPELGSNGSGFSLAASIGLTVEHPVPALAGLLTVDPWIHALAGIVCEQGRLWLDEKGGEKQAHEGPILLTHRGISGPPALALSGEVNVRLRQLHQSGGQNPQIPVCFSIQKDRRKSDWMDLFDHWRKVHGGRSVHNLLSGEMPRGLALAFCAQAGVSECAMAQVSRTATEQLAQSCCASRVVIHGTEGWNRAMVTRGGVACDQVDAKSMRCLSVANLFFTGEVLDVDFPCGGYNLTWAFASGRLAAEKAGLLQ